MRAKKIIKEFLFIFFIGAVFFSSGFYFGKEQRVIINPLENIDFRLFNEVYYIIKNTHPEFDNISEEEVVYGAVEGMLEKLGDDHTVFLNPERSKIFIEDVHGEFQGVGIEIGIRDGQLQVVSPLKGTPGDRAGITSGDLITAVDGKTTEDMTIEEAVFMIRGPKGAEVVLEIKRDEEKMEVPITRDVIEIPSIEWEIMEGDIAYIELFSFHEKVEKEFDVIAQEILDSSAEKIIIDLRGNPGGVLNVAVSLTSYFLDSGEVVLLTGKENNGSGDFDEIKTRDQSLSLDYPLVIIINQGSASASEIMAGALQDHNKATIIGETSFGKGSIQSMKDLIGGSLLKVTERYFFTPEKSIINGKGISPDIEVELTEEDIDQGVDPQLEEAVNFLKNNY
jgi:carboxyl-terminal processing protease